MSESLPYVPGSDTSKTAAEMAAPDAARARKMVFDFIVKQGDATDDEVKAGIADHQGHSARRRELELTGWVRKAGKRRQTRAGKPAEVYEPVPEDERDAHAAKAQHEKVVTDAQNRVREAARGLTTVEQCANALTHIEALIAEAGDPPELAEAEDLGDILEMFA